MTTNKQVVAIDIGSTSLKAAVIDCRGKVLTCSRVEYGAFNFKPNEFSGVWLRALKEACGQAETLRHEISAISISGNGPTLVSEDGTTLLWSEKVPYEQSSCQKNIKSGNDGTSILKLESMPQAQAAIYAPRVEAFKRLFPGSYERTKTLWTAPGFTARTVRENPEEFGLPAVTVFVTGPDFIAALIGSNTLTPGRLCDRAGSSEGINLCISTPPDASVLQADGINGAPLRVMPSVADCFWNLSYLIEDPGDSPEEKAKIFAKGISILRQAAELSGEPVDESVTITGGQARDRKLIEAKETAAKINVVTAQIPDAELLGNAAFAFVKLGLYKDIREAADAIVRKDGPTDFSRVKAIIFDIDSTLYTNAAYAFEQVDCQVRHFARLRGIKDDEARKMVGDYRKSFADKNGGKKVSLCNTLASFGIPIEESIKWRRELLEPAEFLSPDLKLQKALETLSKKYRLICVTNNPVLPAQKTLVALGIDKIIPKIIGLDICKKSKPAKEPFILAAAECGVEPDECLSIGDRYDLDIAPALELGMQGLLVKGVEDIYTLASCQK